MIRVGVDGFRTSEERERALRMFMDAKGIARPTAPILDDEFFNPLFMTSVCRSMAKAHIHRFPDGLHGARDIFQFVLRAKVGSLGTPYDGNGDVYNALLEFLAQLAKLMVERNHDCVPIDKARELIDLTFRGFPLGPPGWFAVLLGADILRRDIERGTDETKVFALPPEVVRFTFQRLQENLIAEHLGRECTDVDIDRAFDANGPWAFLLRRSTKMDGQLYVRPHPRWIGVLGALWSLVAEKHKKELWDLSSFFGGDNVRYYPNDLRPVFRNSLRERRGDAFSDRTKVILDQLWDDEVKDRLAIFLSTSCIPNHAWNADFLSARLTSLSHADREVVWSEQFADGDAELVKRRGQHHRMGDACPGVGRGR